MNHIDRFDAAFAQCPVVAILRGVRPEEVLDIGHALVDAGIHIIEVPLNSPMPFASIEQLAQHLPAHIVVGAGTVLHARDVDRVTSVGGQIMVSPNTSVPVIERTVHHGAVSLPGWTTPTDAFAAYHAGARFLKLFPAGSFPPGHIKAIKAVLPTDARVLAVGGVGSHNASEWRAAGADGFGIGSEIYKPGLDARTVGDNARAVLSALGAEGQ